MYIIDITSIVKSTLSSLSGVDKITLGSDLYDMGMTSLMSVNLMVELESHFNFHFPHTALNASGFKSIEVINEVITPLLQNKL